MIRWTIIIISVFTSSCIVGTTVDEFRPAHQPEGARIRLNVKFELSGEKTKIQGELLALDDSAFVVLDSLAPGIERITLVPFSNVTSFRIHQGIYHHGNPKKLSKSRRERVRVMSRYPQGISDNLWPKLLQAYSQDEPDLAQGRLRRVVKYDSKEVDRLVRIARDASHEYEDIEMAIQAGYRQVGPDFPGMGEHWVNPRLLMRPVNLANPPVLSYIREKGGTPILTGVAYAAWFEGGIVPDSLPVPAAWHDHTGTVDEETLLLNPSDHSGKGMGDTEKPSALTMLHVWAWLDNPESPISQDNWAVAFVRLGMEPPDDVSPQAGKALYLPVGGVEYYAKLLTIAGDPTPDEKERIKEALERARDGVVQHLESTRSGFSRRGSLDQNLALVWRHMWRQISSSVSRETWLAIREMAY